ncbi:unnamed protein product [Prunus armeniaca]|uniref:Protein kinase domain-containing protein n=1 Tax=Prunus armeniaca TaxID=36596 RepID=A0A6J5WQJ6_PRUAR|nr:unnamed protein product [Prunus armeniaca]
MQKLSLCSYLNLHQNSFAGEIPEWIGELKSLETLDHSGNRFLGEVPSSIGNLQALKVLNFSANGFTGSLPKSMAYCTSLVALDFSKNSMAGELPAWIFKAGLEEVSLSEKKLSGSANSPVSSSIGNAPQNLQVVDLSLNQFSGEIASDIGVLSSLLSLNLSGNSLVGHIPVTIGELKALDNVDLSENRLSGSIPLEIGGAFSLKELRLENNLLTGKIPTSIGNCSSLTTLIASQNRLTGPVPAAMAKLTNLQNVDLSFNNLTGGLPKQLANLPNLLSFNISHNNLQVLPKPIVLNPNSSSDSTTPGTLSSNLGHRRIILSISALIAIAAAAVIVIGVIAITVLNLHVRSSPTHSPAALTLSAGDDFSHSPTTDDNSGKLVMFSGEPDFSTGAHALLNKDCELGRGGFGAVYRTVLPDGRPVAIKKLTVSSLVKSQEEFEREVKKLGKVRHDNLVENEGYYWTPSLQLIIYEYVSGGSLYKHLHDGAGGNFLSWNDRFNIILGTPKSLAHLHQMNIIHYNLESSNVLIGSSGEPKVGRLWPSKVVANA